MIKYKKGIKLIHHHVENLIVDKYPLGNLKLTILNNRYRDAFLGNDTRIYLFRNYASSTKNEINEMWIKFLTQLSSKIETFVVLSKDTTKEDEKRILIKHLNQIGSIYSGNDNKSSCNQFNTEINSNELTIKKLMENNISIKEYCENECPEYNICIYLGSCQHITEPIRRGGFRKWIGIQNQLGHILPTYMFFMENIILFIDRNLSDMLKDHFSYSKSMIQKNLKFLDKILAEDNNERSYRDFIEELKKLLEIFRKSLLKNSSKLDYLLIDAILNNINLLKEIGDTHIRKLNEQTYNYVKNGELELFSFIFGVICNFIDNYENFRILNNREDVNNWLSTSLYKEDHKITFQYYDKCVFETNFKKDNLAKLIINDI